ncbi:MAG: hypothetical protein ABDI19_03925, partial [Armatimonadota bacterium]
MRQSVSSIRRKGEWFRRVSALGALSATLLLSSYAQWMVTDFHGIYVPNQTGGAANYAWRISEGPNPYIVGQAGQGIFGLPVGYRYQLGIDAIGTPSRIIGSAVAYGVNNQGWVVGRDTA